MKNSLKKQKRSSQAQQVRAYMRELTSHDPFYSIQCLPSSTQRFVFRSIAFMSRDCNAKQNHVKEAFFICTCLHILCNESMHQNRL
jgi:hypothetical protein